MRSCRAGLPVAACNIGRRRSAVARGDFRKRGAFRVCERRIEAEESSRLRCAPLSPVASHRRCRHRGWRRAPDQEARPAFGATGTGLAECSTPGASAKDDQGVAEYRLALAQKSSRTGARHDGFNVKQAASQQCFVQWPAVIRNLRLRLLGRRDNDGQAELGRPRPEVPASDIRRRFQAPSSRRSGLARQARRLRPAALFRCPRLFRLRRP